MKIIYIECTAEEMRANRTVLDNITEAISGITRTIAGVDITAEDLANAYNEYNEEETEEVE